MLWCLRMKTLRLVLSDQLSLSLASLCDVDKTRDIVLMAETVEEATYVKHHKQKLVFQFSSMRHFADELKNNGIDVEYYSYDQGLVSLDEAVKLAVKTYKPERIALTFPSEYRLLEKFKAWQSKFDIPVEIHDDDRFYSDLHEFKQDVKNRKQLRLEQFYRKMRVRSGLLMLANGKPVGGKWNYDAENRNPWRGEPALPARKMLEPDVITQSVIKLVESEFADHFGTLQHFDFAVTRKQALARLKYFIKHILQYFGDYQDAMHTDSAYLFHSILSPYLNAGLLLAAEVCEAAEQAYTDKIASINAVEGFIRQILGWREFIRCIYWTYMPAYAEKNYFKAKRPLPDFYWTADTDMQCMKTAIEQTRDYAYSHHIQRLMVTGNFALLTGIDIKQVCEWYLLVYADAYDWVELPNTLGMSLFGDGGLFASKPYAASGKYINRMSNFCKSCQYNVKESVGDDACPFNSLYWHFMQRHAKQLRSNQRLTYTYASWDKMDAEKKEAIIAQADKFLRNLNK